MGLNEDKGLTLVGPGSSRRVAIAIPVPVARLSKGSQMKVDASLGIRALSVPEREAQKRARFVAPSMPSAAS